MDGSILRCTGVTKRFGGVSALENVDVVAERGGILGIIGPNGSGKTTLLNVISGIYQPTAGRIECQGKDITGLPAFRVSREGIARTFQNIRLFRNLSCEENVLVGLHNKTKWWRPNSAATSRAYEMLDFVGLATKRSVTSSSLPYGEQRKLEIARALAADPEILLLDEPAAGMGGREAEDLVTLFMRVNGMGKTLIIIDHNMKVIMNLVDRVMVLDAGAKIQEGTPQQIQADEQVRSIYLGTSVC
ncbi:MAG: ABC transporter ATP-binding protein [Actinobacteria bacterium]|nr:ABC transporter ATP-binding protein [Actinomycetota bacterium]